MILFLLLFSGTVFGAMEDQYVCGKTYMFFYSEVTYLAKFTSSNPDLPCTSGTLSLYWQNKKSTTNFAINSQYLITTTDWGKFVLDKDQLYMLDSATVIFEEY